LKFTATRESIVLNFEYQSFVELYNHIRRERLRVLMPLPDDDFDPSESAVPWKIMQEHGIDVVFATGMFSFIRWLIG
jgi:hypothetical protein